MSFDFLAQDFKTGKVSRENMSTTEIMNHEFIHALAIMNGDSKSEKTVIRYYNDGKSMRAEKIDIEEAVTTFRQYRRTNNGKVLNYPSQNTLQKEQGKKKVVRYTPLKPNEYK